MNRMLMRCVALLVVALFSVLGGGNLAAQPASADSTQLPTLQQALKAAKWWSLNQRAQAVRLWVWSQQQDWKKQLRINYQAEQPVMVLPPLSKMEFREIVPWLAQSMERGSSYYVPQNVQEYLNLQTLPVKNRVGVSVSVSELARAVARGFTRLFNPPEPADLAHMRREHLLALQLLWRSSRLTAREWYLQFAQNFPHTPLTYRTFARWVDFLLRAGLIQSEQPGNPESRYLPAISQKGLELRIREKLRWLDPVRHPRAFQHYQQLLEVLTGEPGP